MWSLLVVLVLRLLMLANGPANGDTFLMISLALSLFLYLCEPFLALEGCARVILHVSQCFRCVGRLVASLTMLGFESN